MTSNWSGTLQGQITLHMYNRHPWFPNFTPFRHMTTCFRDTSRFEISAPNDPKMTLNTSRSYVPHIYVTSIQNIPNFTSQMSQISLQFALRWAIFGIQAIWDKCTEWPQNHLKHYKVKGTPHICYQCPRLQNFTPFCCTISPFQYMAHIIIPNWLQC